MANGAASRPAHSRISGTLLAVRIRVFGLTVLQSAHCGRELLLEYVQGGRGLLLRCLQLLYARRSHLILIENCVQIVLNDCGTVLLRLKLAVKIFRHLAELRILAAMDADLGAVLVQDLVERGFARGFVWSRKCHRVDVLSGVLQVPWIGLLRMPGLTGKP